MAVRLRSPKVPIEAFATGPKAIAASARAADSVMLAMSAAPARVAWGVDVAQKAAAEAGKTVSLGCMVVATPHDDIGVSRDLARAQVATQARFSVMNNKIQGPATDQQAETLLKIASVYDMNKHAHTGGSSTAAAQAEAVTDDFVDQFGIVGSVDQCVERFSELADLGVDHMSVWVPYVQSAETRRSYELLVNEVLPRVRAS